MKRIRPAKLFLPLLVFALSSTAVAQSSGDVDTSEGDRLVTEYFRQQERAIRHAPLDNVATLEQWQELRPVLKQQLLEMLGLDPFPQRTALQPEVTGQVEHDEMIVERIQFQSMPGLYVTGNLYRPREQDKPLPAILYVCGHARVRENGVSYGNKAAYQHHGAWFARNGYVCLTIDTIQLGEIEGIHHGTYREKMWWWNNRGYTPAGVEAWNCVRSLDYLQSRDEVDGERLGITGRSGGGVYSWWAAAIDERIKVTVPVAGITNLKNYVVDGCVEGHCDCMFMVNTYRWDYATVAAMVAPRPLLISNSDKDRIFPLDGVVDVHREVREIYRLYDAEENLGLQITEGPHKDTQELRVHAFRWFNRFLKKDDRLIEQTAVKFFEPEQLKVFDELPEDERVTTIHESFVPAVSAESLPSEEDEIAAMTESWKQQLRSRVFRGWPADPPALDVEVVEQVGRDPQLSVIHFTSQSPYRLPMYLLRRTDDADAALSVVVLDQAGWESTAAALAAAMANQFPQVEADQERWQEMKSSTDRGNVLYVVPRGVGPTEWSREERTRTHIRRRFMLVGQTAAGMQVFDVHRALAAVGKIPQLKWSRLDLQASGQAAQWALYASLWQDRVDSLQLVGLPKTNREAADLLNVSRFVELPHVVLMAAKQTGDVTLPSSWRKVFAKHPYADSKIDFQP